uniref:C-type lectin domain-containing protein n=1 Tax=Oryzias melastigma TaxID=30732 RepID=A0A3B3CRT2_ORYME
MLFVSGELCFIKCCMYEYKYIDSKMTWTEAQEYCRENHTDLATVTNMTDVKRLNQTAKQRPAWIGLKKNTISNKMWHWSLPGVSFNKNKTHWNMHEPNNDGSELCVLLTKDLTWIDDPCNKDQRFICYNETNTSQKFHLIETPLNWTNAQRYCRENHTDLISGLQQLDQLNQTWNDSMKEKLVKNITYVFIGLFSDAWAWSDESSFSFRNWDQQRYRDNGQKGCAGLTDDGMWNTEDCSEQKIPFICYEDHVILINESRTWEEALYYCRHYYNDLVTITNLDDQRWVQEKTKNATTLFVWTGLRYTCTLGFWFWVSDEVVRYKNWASPEQVNECDMSGAMETGGEHKWVKKHDEEKLNFFCSK